MIGAYMAFALAPYFGDWYLTKLLVGVACQRGVGFVLEWVFFSFLYQREHLQQVLMTYALILVFEEARSLLVGNDVHGVTTPAWLAGGCSARRADVVPVVCVFASLACVVGPRSACTSSSPHAAWHDDPGRRKQPRTMARGLG